MHDYIRYLKIDRWKRALKERWGGDLLATEYWDISGRLGKCLGTRAGTAVASDCFAKASSLCKFIQRGQASELE